MDEGPDGLFWNPALYAGLFSVLDTELLMRSAAQLRCRCYDCSRDKKTNSDPAGSEFYIIKKFINP